MTVRRDLTELAHGNRQDDRRRPRLRYGGGPEHGHRHRPGPGPGGSSGNFGWGPFGFGGGWGGGPGGPWRRGGPRKARRGDIRIAALILIAEEPRNGYQIMQEVQERSGGMWSPSPGSVYPALAQLEDEGLIRSHDDDGRKLFGITDAGRAAVDERPADARAPWDEATQGISDQAMELGGLMKEVAMAFVQVMRVGGEKQMAEAKTVLATARRSLYRILADGADEDDAPEAEGGTPEDAPQQG